MPNAKTAAHLPLLELLLHPLVLQLSLVLSQLGEPLLLPVSGGCLLSLSPCLVLSLLFGRFSSGFTEGGRGLIGESE